MIIKMSFDDICFKSLDVNISATEYSADPENAINIVKSHKAFNAQRSGAYDEISASFYLKFKPLHTYLSPLYFSRHFQNWQVPENILA